MFPFCRCQDQIPGRTSQSGTGPQRTSISGSTAIAIKAQGGMADVTAERERIDAMTDFSNTPIVMQGIGKVYPGMDGGKPKVRPSAAPVCVVVFVGRTAGFVGVPARS